MGFLSKMFAARGAFPAELRAQLESEGIAVIHESVKGARIYRSYRMPGRRGHLERVGLIGSVAVTQERLVVHGNQQPIINLPWSDERSRQIRVSVDSEALRFSFDLALFHDDWSGSAEVKLRVPEAQTALDEIVRRQSAPTA